MSSFLFFRWQIMREDPPTFKRRQDWYRIHVLKGANPQAEMCYDTQYDWTAKLFDQAGLHSLKKTQPNMQSSGASVTPKSASRSS
jgi:hypothetical protein